MATTSAQTTDQASTIGEGTSVEGPRPLMAVREARMAAAAPTPVSPGELDVRIDITGLYELGR